MFCIYFHALRLSVGTATSHRQAAVLPNSLLFGQRLPQAQATSLVQKQQKKSAGVQLFVPFVPCLI